ncbi:MAG: diguanylate cyclase [Myxococcota bacterium]
MLTPPAPLDEDLDISVARVMSTDLLEARPEETVAAVAARMHARSTGSALVTRHGALDGLFTERDLLKRVVGAGRSPDTTTVGEVMTTDVHVLDVATPVGVAFELLNARGFRHVPVTAGGRLVGVVSMRDLFRVRLRHVEALLSEEAGALKQARDLLALDDDGRARALMDVNARLRELALTDELTGLYNHRYLMQRLDEEMARAVRHKTALALLIVDIDHFKKVNDTWGHTTGDLVLRHVADVLRSSVGGGRVIARLRRGDIVARYGGEEFAVMLPDARCRGARVVADRIHADLAARPAIVPNVGEVPVRVSIGAASWPHCAADLDDLVRAADTALYAAKEAGRDTTRVACGDRIAEG